MSNIVLGALLDDLFSGPSHTEEALRKAGFASLVTRIALWVIALVVYGAALGYLQQDNVLAKTGLVLVGLSMLPAALFVLLLGPEMARDWVLRHYKASGR